MKPRKAYEYYGPGYSKKRLDVESTIDNILNYLEQSEKEQASWEKPLKGEESWAVLVGDNRSVRIFGSKEDVKWAMDKLQSDEMEKEAKPQEEPKCCEKCFSKDGWMKGECFNSNCPCHQKESELPKNRPCKHESGTEGNCSKCGASPYPEKESESKERDISEDNMVAGLIAYGRLNNHIVLPRPKGMSIGEALSEFIAWSGYTDYGRDDIGRAKDQDFLKLWQEWLTSLKK